MKPKLAISIPTYGYPNSVTANISRLLECKRQDIEIVVVDNDASGTQIKKQMLEIHDKRFHYYQNECNIGRANNIVKAVERAEADFVLLMSSDDELYLDSIGELIGVIDQFSNLALIMGTIVTDLGGQAYAKIAAGRYEKGFQVLNVLPFLGNLLPFVINKKYIKCAQLYGLEETYMQNRLALTVANSGDLVVLDRIIGMQVDNMSDRYGGTIEIFENGTGLSTWNTGGCYYGPYNRIEQLKAELDIINQYQMRMDKKLKIVDKFVSRRMGHLCTYIVGCHDPYEVKVAGTEGFMTYEEVFNIFLERMEKYFVEIEQKKYYIFSGRLQDIIKNELLLIEQAETIMCKIKENNVVVWEQGDKSRKLIGMLGLMNIRVKGIIADKSNVYDDVQTYELKDLKPLDVVLIPDVYNDDIETQLKKENFDRYFFMDQMNKYLAVVYCSKHLDENSMKPFLNYY